MLIVCFASAGAEGGSVQHMHIHTSEMTEETFEAAADRRGLDRCTITILGWPLYNRILGNQVVLVTG